MFALRMLDLLNARPGGCQNLEMLNLRIVRLWGCQTLGMLNLRIVRPSNCQFFRFLDLWIVRPLDCQTFGLLDLRIVRSPGCQANVFLNQLKVLDLKYVCTSEVQALQILPLWIQHFRYFLGLSIILAYVDVFFFLHKRDTYQNLGFWYICTSVQTACTFKIGLDTGYRLIFQKFK